jgi:hypothetical protein
MKTEFLAKLNIPCCSSKETRRVSQPGTGVKLGKDAELVSRRAIKFFDPN